MTEAFTDNSCPMNVIHKPIIIVIYTISRNLLGIDPHVCGQIWMIVVNTRIDDRYGDRLVASSGQTVTLKVGPGCFYVGRIEMPLIIHFWIV